MINAEETKIIIFMTITFLLTLGSGFYLRYKLFVEPNKKKEEEYKKLKEHRT